MDRKELEFLRNELRTFGYYIKQYEDLYRDPTTWGLLNKTAPEFFRVYWHLSWDYFTLSITRLLEDDNATTISIVNFHQQNRSDLKLKSEEEAETVDRLLL